MVNKQLTDTYCAISHDNQKMKFGQVIGCNRRNIFLQKECRKWGRETRSRPLLWRQYISIVLPCYRIKRSCIKLHTAGPEILLVQRYYWSRDIMLNFDFFRKESGISFSTTFYIWFFNKIISHSIFYYIILYHCLIACTLWDIRQYVHYNCL